jgi:uncharacterized C2H2 Zn-finger protein
MAPYQQFIDFLYGLLYLVIFVGFVLLVVAVAGRVLRCPRCGDSFARRHHFNESHGYTYDTKTIEVKLPVKNERDKDTGDYVVQEREVPVTTHTYTPHYECRKCNHRWHGSQKTEEV